MLELYIGNKKGLWLAFFCIILTFGFLQAQEQKTVPDIEKIYLHTDKSVYFMGEDLWYKAYTVRASNNLLFDNSNILYVELISPDSKIIARNKTNIEMGLGHGDFQLVDSLGVKPGVYQLRAYTNWNRNFGEDFVFKKNIEIRDVFESRLNPDKVLTSTVETKSKTFKTINQNNCIVGFFPEGGSLLENVASVVGFKAVDNNGKPINAKGEIYDSDDEWVASFSSRHDGMGKFQMIPMEGKKYYAKIKTPTGAELRQELPKVADQGYLLSFKTFKGKNIVSLLTNEKTLLQNPNATLTVVGQAKGISYLETRQTLAQTTLSFELPKDKTPDGISQITLYDSNNKPQSERLVFIETDKDLEVLLATDKASYQPNEKATVNVSSKSKAGVAKSASFSLSVTDMNGVLEDKEYGTTISSCFLLESDIRGKVHNPGYYFDATNANRLEYLDYLLLTQGWRDFLWKTMPKANDSITYNAEKGITISGRVKQVLGDKPKVNNKMSLTLSNKKQMNFFVAITDSLGVFKFDNLMFAGKTNMYLNTRDEKGKFRGEIVLDSIGQPPLLVSFKEEPINWSETTRTIVENVFKKFTAFGVKPENMLDEVKIKSKKKKYATVLYGVPDYSYMIDKKEAAKFFNVRDLIEETVKGTHFSIIPISPVAQVSDPESLDPVFPDPVVIIDGYTISDYAELSMVSPEEVLKIEVASGMHVAQIYGSYSIISIFTNGNRGNKPKKDNYQSIKQQIDGFYRARVFYSPNPEQAELDNKAAVRNTLYWNPEIYQDATGNAAVSYYNTKVETKVKVALGGITATGIPVVKKAYYTIKK